MLGKLGRGGEHEWTDEYREIVTFHFWEPQHLRPKRLALGRTNTPAEMWARVSRLEVSTNHILNLYLSMVPFEVVADGRWYTSGHYSHYSSTQLRDDQERLGRFTQPDLYLTGDDHDLAIEIKTATRSSVEQVHKYVCFQELLRPGRPLTLLFLTRYADTNEVFKERIGLDAVRDRLRQQPPPGRHENLAGRLPSALDRLTLGALTFQELGGRVAEILRGDVDPVARRVHAGLLTWLTERGLYASSARSGPDDDPDVLSTQ